MNVRNVLPKKRHKQDKSYDILLVPSNGEQTKFIRNVTIRKMLMIVVVLLLVVFFISMAVIMLSLPFGKNFMMFATDDIDSETVVVEKKDIDSLRSKLKSLSEYGNKLKSLFSEPDGQSERVSMVTNSHESEAVFGHNLKISPSDLHVKEGRTDNSSDVTMLGHLVQGSVTRGFNPEISHYGLDVATASSESIGAFDDGSVLFADWSSKYGYVVIIVHGSVVTFYKHCGRIFVSQGETVKKGEVIALVGNTGTESQSPHLHFEIWENGVPQDPASYLYIDSFKN